MYPGLSTFGPTSSRYAVQLLPIRKDADGHWPLRPGIRARRLWRRHGGRSPRPSRPRHRGPRPHRPRAPGPPRRVGRRGRDGRRRRHPGAGPAPLPGRRGRRRRASRCPSAGGYAVGLAFLPTDADDAHKARTVVEQTPPRRDWPCSGGATVPTEPDGLGKTARGAMPRIRAAVRGAGRARRRHHGARAARLRAAQAGRARGRRRLLPLALGADARLQGHAHLRAAAPVLPRPARPRPSSRAWRSCTRASRPTPSRAGRWPTRTATSATTARSTRWPATATGCGPARRSSRRR